MADDIDIEEHNLLDNPRIKIIFPDITSIKTEVPDYEEYGEVTEETGRSGVEDFEEETIHYAMQEVMSNEEMEYVNNDNPEPIEYENDLYPNKIILGSKPCSESPTPLENYSEPSIQECSIVLQDFRPILDNSPYCSLCQTLFPTENALDSHKMTSHSFLVAVSNNKAKKSTSKSSISALECIPVAPKVCNHCNETFPDDNALLKHSYDLIPEKIEDDVEVVASEEQSEENSNVNYISCEICSCLFKYKGHYMVHMINYHGVESEELPVPAVINLQCRFCPYVARNKTKYNKHICKRHRKLYEKKVKTEIPDQFKCGPCNISFLTAYSQKIHRALYHPDISKIRTHTSLEGKEGNINLFSTLRSYYRRPIPKSTVFSCDKCQIHFVSCLVACEHSKRCVLTKGDWKCAQCRLSFKMADREAHLKQHEVSDRLNVIKVREGILDRILCRCLSCNICYDERNILKYHSFGCSSEKSVICTECPLRIHKYAIKKHKRIHSELRDQHFVIVDFIPDDKRTSKALPEEPKPRKRKFNAVYYYCPSCELCMKINRKSDNHATGNCNKFLPKCLCKFCGLRFTLKSYQSHEEVHKRLPNLKLSDIMFRSTQNGLKINPPFPDFKKCKKCKVCFFSTVALRSHICYAEEVKICDYCGEKLSDLAYKLHVPFHEYRKQKKMVNELFKKYDSLKSIWNILYVCVTCDSILDNYDRVVEHAQDHFCDKENYKVTINHCDICDLRFMGESYRRHERLHAGNISKSSFEIIEFNHETLLSDKWLDMFRTLDPAQVDQILKRSIYKDTRSARMTVLDPKDSEFRLYQCGVCKVMVESNKIIDHTHNRVNCVKTTNISCNLCQFRFDSKHALRSHLGLHENLQIYAMAFKIISFNNEKDAFVNDSLKSVMNPEALRFIRCLHCKKLIKKVKYSKHVINHRYSDKKKQEKMKNPKFVVRPKIKKTGIAPNLFYKCKLCGVCVLKQTIKIHYCSQNNHKKQCDKCLLWFRASNFQKHELYHEKYKFTKGVNVVSFENGVIESVESISMENNTVLFQCTECKTCLHYKHNISKHKCLSFKYLRQCNLCEVSFHSSHFNIHEKLHDAKSFSKENVNIMKFTPPSKVKSLKKALVPVTLKNNEATRYLNETSLKKQIVSQEFTRNLENGDDTNFELADENYFKRLYCRVFRCDKCQVLFLTGSALVKHTKCCDEDRDSVKCKCGLLFHSSALELHQKLQRCGKSGTTKYFVVTLISENIADFDLRKCLYTCRECDVYYLSLYTISRHFEQNHLEVRTLVKCEQCNLPFSSISNTKHNRLHHKTHNWSISDLYVFEVKYITMAQTTNDFSEESMCDESFVSTSDHTSSEKKSVQKEHAKKPVVANKVRKIGLKTVSKELKRNFKNGNRTNFELTDENYFRRLYCRVFKCEKCQVLFLTGSALVKHAKCCDEDRDSVKCECGLLFHPSALKFHQKWQRCGQSEITKYYVFTLISENIVDFHLTKCLYTCRACDVYYINIHTVSKHFEDNHLAVSSLVQCEQCNLPFSLISNTKHNKLHHNKHNWSPSDLNIFEVKYITLAQIMNDFPEDSICNESIASTANDPSTERKLVKRKHDEEPVVANKVLKIGSKPVSEELTRNLENGDGTDIELIDKNSIRYMYCRLFKCEKCKVLFMTAFALVQHTKCCDEDRDSIKCKCGLLFHSSALELHQKWQRCGKSGETECYIVTLISENIVDFDHGKCLYTCRECNIYFLTFNTATVHYERQRHVINSMLYKCEQCNIDFSGISLSRHNKLHHETQNWSLSDLNIFEVKYMTLTQIMNDFPEDSIYNESFTSTANDPSSEKKTVKRRHVEEPVVANKVLQKEDKTWYWSGTCDMTNIYKCHVCDLSFLHNKTLSTHYYVGRHNEQRMTCICGHSFTGKSLRRHLDAPADVPISELEKLIKSFKKDKLNESQNDEVTVKTGNTLKLFKCSVCDVYFLTDEVCHDHITNHQVLDPTEYIACKICELQFLCEYLGAHMKTHRDKTFNIEDVMVTELQPDKGTEDTYRAIDRLKSKAVSTTTHFDTEDEKNECIDSSNQLDDSRPSKNQIEL